MALKGPSTKNEKPSFFDETIQQWEKLAGAATYSRLLERDAPEPDQEEGAHHRSPPVAQPSQSLQQENAQPPAQQSFLKQVPPNHWKDEWARDTSHGCAFTGCVAILQWLLPFFFNVVANLSMSFMLHIGTYYYIQVMDRFEHAYSHVATSDTHVALSAGLSKGDISYGSLEDPVEAHLGWTKISLHELDTAALVLPVLWFLLIVIKRDVQIWSKTLVCHGMLALIKGILACLTIVPDSIGWEACKARLGSDNLATIAKIPDPFVEPGKAFGALWQMEWLGYMDHKPVRFCADMIYSGHTFVTCLYGFALIELTRKSFIQLPRSRRIIIQLCVSAFFGLEQLYEIRLVVLNRFHYTIDIFLAILMVLLWYTNGPLALAVSKWSKWGHSPRQPLPAKWFIPTWHMGEGEDKKDRNKLEQQILHGKDSQLRDRFEFIAAAKDVTKETVAAAAKLGLIVVDVPKMDNYNRKVNPEFENAELPVGLQMWAHRWGLGLVPREAFENRDGDLWVPPACLPFSCFLMGERSSVVANSFFEKYDPHQMHKSDPTAWCSSGFPEETP